MAESSWGSRCWLCLAVVALLGAGCGDSVRARHGPTTAAVTALRISSWPHGPARPGHAWTLRCRPASGTHPRPEAACDELERRTAALATAQRPCRFAARADAP